MGRAARESKKRQIGAGPDGSPGSIYGTAAEVKQAASDSRRLEKIGLVLGGNRILDPNEVKLIVDR
jgi:hypothetical protein